MQCVKTLILFLSLISLSVFADSGLIEVTPISLSAGHTVKWAPEPYFRWTTKIQLAGGQWESRDFIVSSDALLELLEGENLQLIRTSERLFQAGAFETLWKGGHVGLGFEGVTWGTDIDRQYSQLIRTGIYAMINVIRTEAMRLDIHSGYEFESKHINLSDPQTSGLLPQEVVMRWRTRFLTGRLYASVAPQTAGEQNLHTMRVAAGTKAKVRILSVKDLRIGLGLDLHSERDPRREAWGLDPTSTSASVFLDLSYVNTFDGHDYGVRINKW